MLGDISVNQVFVDGALGSEIRVLYISPDKSYLYWIELSPKGGLPKKEEMPEFETRMMAGDLQRKEDTWQPPRDDGSESARDRRDEHWKLLGSVLTNP